SRHEFTQEKGHTLVCPFLCLQILPSLCSSGGCQSFLWLDDRRFRCFRGFCLRLLLILLLLFAALYLDAALENSAVLHTDPDGGNVAVDHAFTANIHAVAAFDVADDFTHHHNFASGNVGLYTAVAADGHAILRERDLAFDPAVNIERFRAGDFALDDKRPANGGLFDGRGGGFDRVVRVRVGGG